MMQIAMIDAKKIFYALPTLVVLVLLSVSVLGQSLSVSYLLPPCGSKEPARFYVFTGGASVGQTVVVTITSLQGVVKDPQNQEAPYRPTLAKGVIIQQGGMAQNITFPAIEGKVEVRATLQSGAYSLKGVYFTLNKMCR